MVACFGGWSLDALDVQIFSFVIPSLLSLWGITTAEAGVLATVTLVVSSFGGWLAGAISDRLGRVRVLQITILWYALFTFLCGFAQDFNQLFVLKALQGLGFGGEWAAGAVLMGEVIRDKYRGRAVGFVQTGWSVGWGAAALLYTLLSASLPEALTWKVMFWIGLAPAALVFWIRRFVDEPMVKPREAGAGGVSHVFSVLRSPYWSTTWRVSMMVMGAQGSSYAITTFLPTYLKTTRHLTSVGTGSYLLVLILGAFFGFLSGAYLSDAIGRKSTFMISAIGSVVLMLVYLFAPLSNDWILPVGFLLGYINLMMFSPMGPFMTELYPTSVRGVGQGFCYNAGRGIGAVFPALVGFLAAQWGLAAAIAIFSFAGLSLMILALLMLPETKGRSLESLEQRPGAGVSSARSPAA
ncbi:MAG TPA: MFS transporter [Rhodopila sp.]|uniref:MFS transporter n=1 Tax=Rhodopila sp. TaxID=2480087 RepID=UPI002C5E6BEE|nr:MFS transporter [Rhodopila sp.]HVY14309.1 MFS transporter [Rhodopila sp.]